ncbi:MAG: hypothetical protein H0V44_11060 [Planctomycetes bacterium]|nr:hypothetical protein [Planctomycetota bacterium]
MDRAESLQKHAGDLYVLERHILKAVARQRVSERLLVMPEAGTVVLAIDRILARHVGALETYLTGFGADHRNGVARALSRMSGTVAGLYERMRDQAVSRMLRDDYAALSMAAISYEMLHTVGLAHRDMHLAQISLVHLQDLTTQIIDLSRIIPHVVATEIAQEEGGDPSVAAEAEKNTHRAWTHEIGV